MIESLVYTTFAAKELIVIPLFLNSVEKRSLEVVQ